MAHLPFAHAAAGATRRFAWMLRVLLLASMAVWAGGCASVPSQVERKASSALATPEQTALGALAQQRRAAAKAGSDSAFHLLENVDEAFTSRLALIDRAQKTLDLQYYAIHADASTEVLLQQVRIAAARGVRVRILLDDFNTAGEDAQVLRLAFVPNVEVRLFNPVPGSRQSIFTRVLGSLHDFKRMQKRMHNKLFIADNAWGITGGRNLGDAYFGGDDRSAFVDLDVLAAGRIVRNMSATFDRYWNDELAYPVQALLDRADLDRLRGGEPSRATSSDAPAAASHATLLPNVSPGDAASARRAPMALERIAITWAPSVLLVDKPEKVQQSDDQTEAGDTVIDGLLGLMNQARREVLVISPYFVPGGRMLETLAQLRARGVAVRVLTNSLASNDAPAAHAGYARYRPALLRMGVELYEMRSDRSTATGLGSQAAPARGASGGSALGSSAGGSKSGTSRASLHSKAVIIDRGLAVIGSMNLDLRSQLQNSEVALLIRSGAVAQQSARLIENSFAHSAYRVQLLPDGGLRWKAPAGAPFADTDDEPDAPLKLRLLVRLIGPLAPDEML